MWVMKAEQMLQRGQIKSEQSVSGSRKWSKRYWRRRGALRRAWADCKTTPPLKRGAHGDISLAHDDAFAVPPRVLTSCALFSFLTRTRDPTSIRQSKPLALGLYMPCSCHVHLLLIFYASTNKAEKSSSAFCRFSAPSCFLLRALHVRFRQWWSILPSNQQEQHRYSPSAPAPPSPAASRPPHADPRHRRFHPSNEKEVHFTQILHTRHKPPTAANSPPPPSQDNLSPTHIPASTVEIP